MASNWKTVALDQLYEFSSGLSKPRSAFGSGYPFLSFKDIFYNSSVPVRLNELVNSTEQERFQCSVRRGDVFLTRTSETMDELGISCVALRDVPNATFNGFTKRLRPKSVNAVVPEYARYYFRAPTFRQAVTAMSSLSTRASLNNEMLSRLAITLPPLELQAAIGHVLGTLDEKIEQNRRIGETLEAIARALFKSWFVDFAPVRAKAEGRDPGLPQPLANLFPDSFEDSDLGEIPRGWDVKSFANTIEILGGGTPRTSVAEYWGGDIPWFAVADAPTRSEVWVVDTEKKVTHAGVENSSTRVLPLGTTIISARGTVGRVALVGVPMAMNQSCYGLRGLVGARGFFNYYSTLELVARLQQHAHGSVFDTITRDTLAGVSVVVPPSELVEHFEKRVCPSLERIRAGLLEMRTLAALRDTLLPHLISGDLRLKQVERFIERVSDRETGAQL